MALGPASLPKNQEITVAHVCDLFPKLRLPLRGRPTEEAAQGEGATTAPEAEPLARRADVPVVPVVSRQLLRAQEGWRSPVLTAKGLSGSGSPPTRRGRAPAAMP